MLGSSITIERRKVDVCCLNGHEYDREFNFEICTCAEEDYEWYVHTLKVFPAATV